MVTPKEFPQEDEGSIRVAGGEGPRDPQQCQALACMDPPGSHYIMEKVVLKIPHQHGRREHGDGSVGISVRAILPWFPASWFCVPFGFSLADADGAGMPSDVKTSESNQEIEIKHKHEKWNNTLSVTLRRHLVVSHRRGGRAALPSTLVSSARASPGRLGLWHQFQGPCAALRQLRLACWNGASLRQESLKTSVCFSDGLTGNGASSQRARGRSAGSPR